MSFKTDKRYNPSRFRNPDKDPGRYKAEGRRSTGASAVSQRFHAESDKKMQYQKKVVCEKVPYAREE
jgi:hypothetical protein